MSKLALDLSADEERRVRDVLHACRTVHIPAGFVCGADDLPDAAILVVEEGIALLVAEAEAERQIVLAPARPGAVLVPPAADARVTGLTNTHVTVVSRAAYHALLRSSTRSRMSQPSRPGRLIRLRATTHLRWRRRSQRISGFHAVD